MTCLKNSMLIPYSILLLSLMICSSVWAASAEWLSVSGRAPLSSGNYEAAKSQAMAEAFKQATLQSQQQSPRAYLGKSLIVKEHKQGGDLVLDMSIEIKHHAVCELSKAQSYKKQLAVVGFSLQVPQQARMGRIGDIERGFASQLAHTLQARNTLQVYEQSHISLHQDLRNAPSHYTEQLTLSQTTHFAKQAGVQFVASGVIRDLGIEDTSAYSNDYWTKLKRLAKSTNMNRRFVVDIFIHDGFSGALVMQQQFATEGDWQAELSANVGFESLAFQQQDYGTKVYALLDAIADEVTEQLQCQPFMTRVSRVEGKTLHFSAGAGAGIRPGDTFSLYRSSNFFDADRLAGIDLQNVKTALTVSQVHPHFSSGTIAVDPGRLNIQEDDLLIAW